MKKTLLILFAFLFGYLFYRQHLGLNVLLFIPVVLGVLTTEKLTINGYTIAFLLTGIGVFINPCFATGFALLIAMFVYIGKTYAPQLSLYLAVFNGAVNTLAGGIHFLAERKEKPKKSQYNGKFWFLSILIIVPVVIIFISLYRQSNPVFDKLISSIDLSFINFGFLFTSLLGYSILFNIKNPVLIKEMTEVEKNTPEDLVKPDTHFEGPLLKKIQNENLQASILIGTLNLLLLLFLITDLFLYGDSEAMSFFSKNVHSGVNTLITSIILAIAIISIYFRGNLNFYKNNNLLKGLTYTWLILNTLLVVSTLYKNGCYVYYHGLTYKRIGVFIYLFLVIVGLFYTYSKINLKKTLWYVIKKSCVIGFFLFAGLSIIPYSKLVAYYNIQNAIYIDVNYTMSLSLDNSIILWESRDQILEKTGKDFSADFLRNVEMYKTYLESQNWPSYNLDTFIYHP